MSVVDLSVHDTNINGHTHMDQAAAPIDPTAGHQGYLNRIYI